MAVPKGPPPKAPKVDLDDLVKQWEADKKSRVFLQLAEAYRKQDALDAAISVLREGLKHHATFVPAHVALARCLLAKGKLAEAQAELEPIYKRSPDNLFAGKLLAQALQERGERQRALAILTTLAPFAPDDEEIIDRMALLKAALGGKSSPKTESGDTAEFTTSDMTGGAAAPAKPAPAPAPAPTAARASAQSFAPVPSDAAVPSEEEDEILEVDVEDEAPLASLPPEPPPIPHPATPPDDLLGAPLSAPEAGDDDEFTSITLAELYEAQGGHAEAATIYERLLRKKPGDPTLLRALERCRARQQGSAPPEPLPSAAATPPPAPPPRPRWEPIRPRATAPPPEVHESEEEVAGPFADASAPAPRSAAAAAGRGGPQGRAARLRATRTELRRWLRAARSARATP